MNLLISLAGLLGIQVEEVTGRIKNLAIANAFIVLCGLIALVFLLIAGFLALSAQMGPIHSALVFAGIFLVIALVILIGLMLWEHSRKRRHAEKRRSSETSALVTSAALTALPVLLKSPLIRKIGLPLAAIAAAVMFIGAHDDDDSAD